MQPPILQILTDPTPAEKPEETLTVLDDAVRIMKGEISGGMWLVLFVCAFLAIILSIYVQYRQTGKLNPHTPKGFSGFYAIVDNLYRIIAGMITLFFIFRLAFVLINKDWFENEDFFIMFAVGAGFGISFGVDRLILWLQRKTNILVTPEITVEPKKDQPE